MNKTPNGFCMQIIWCCLLWTRKISCPLPYPLPLALLSLQMAMFFVSDAQTWIYAKRWTWKSRVPSYQSLFFQSQGREISTFLLSHFDLHQTPHPALRKQMLEYLITQNKRLCLHWTKPQLWEILVWVSQLLLSF